jgi:hypothetical protein
VTGRRLLVLLVVLAAIGIPAGILQALCVGGSCAADPGGARVPFCPLPDALRTAISSGYREGRSADVLAVTADTAMFTQIGGLRLPWPARSASASDPRIPIAFAGAGIAPRAPVPDGATLDSVAPTVAAALRFDRPFPEVRSGTALPAVAPGSAEPPRLVLLIAWKAIGSAELEETPEAWPFLGSLLAQGAGTLEAETGSLPLDPAATLTTIGTGGLPSQHGITGSSIRNDAGAVVEAYGDGAPVSVIASLADDLEYADPRTLVGLVATDPRDRGLVGGGWYPRQDPVDVVIGDPAAAPLAVEVHLASGYGSDATPDVLGVALEGGIARLDRITREIVRLAQDVTGGRTLVVVAGTGTWERSRLAVPDDAAVDAVEGSVPGDAPVVEAVVPGGLFLDQEVLRRQQVTGQVAVDALLQTEAPDGERMMADAFQGFAVSFARYC